MNSTVSVAFVHIKGSDHRVEFYNGNYLSINLNYIEIWENTPLMDLKINIAKL